MIPASFPSFAFTSLVCRSASLPKHAAQDVVAQYLDYLGCGLSNFINIFQPEVIALGGGVSHERDEDLLLPLQSMVLEACFGREADHGFCR